MSAVQPDDIMFQQLFYCVLFKYNQMTSCFDKYPTNDEVIRMQWRFFLLEFLLNLARYFSLSMLLFGMVCTWSHLAIRKFK